VDVAAESLPAPTAAIHFCYRAWLASVASGTSIVGDDGRNHSVTRFALWPLSFYPEKVSLLRGPAMSHKHESLLHAIFEGPVSGNVH